MENKILVLSSQCGDWEALYVNGELISEGHSLGEGKPKEFWWEMYNKYSFAPKDIVYKELSDEDDEMETFHKKLDSFISKYE